MALEKHSIELMKTYNETLVYNYIRLNGAVSRADIARETKMSATSVTRIVGNLINSGLIMEVGTVSGMVGRKPTMLQIIPTGALAIAGSVDYGRVETGLVNIVGEISHRQVKTTVAGMTKEDIIRTIKEQIVNILQSLCPDQLKSVVSIGICVPGIVDVDTGEATSPQLGWNLVPIKSMCDCFNFDVIVENNVKGCVLAEHMFGSARNENDLVVITIGTGIGAAVMLNGTVFRGKHNVAGEIGHMIIEPGGLLCDCGRRGCLQSTLCMSGLLRKTGMRYEEIVKKASAGDANCLDILQDTADKLSCWIANVTNIYDLESIVLYGEMLEQYPPLLSSIQSHYRKYMWNGICREISIRKSSLKYNDLPLLSAAAVVFNNSITSKVLIR